MAQRPAALLVRITIGQLLARWAAIDIFRRQIDEVLLAKAAIRLRARCHRFRQRHRNARLRAGQNLGAVEVATIGDGIELIGLQPTTPEPRPLVAIERLSGSVNEIC